MRRLVLVFLLTVTAATLAKADYLEDQQKEARDRAAYWAAQGYHFDAGLMTAYMMDQKVDDIRRAKFWAAKGYQFDPQLMTAYMMDQKVDDIERAKYWAAQGYQFDPQLMTAYMMDQKVDDILRARYWAKKGYHFDAQLMTAYMMDQKVDDIERAKYWAARGYEFNPDTMTAYMMDTEAAQSAPANPPRSTFTNVASRNLAATAPAVMELTTPATAYPAALPVSQTPGNRALPVSQSTDVPPVAMLQPLAKPVSDQESRASTTKTVSTP